VARTDQEITLAQQPVRSVHISAPLSALSIGYHPVGFVAERVAPVVSVNNENDLYYVWDRGDALRELETLRADGTSAKMADYGWTTAAYACEEYALKTKITDRQRKNADKPLNLEVAKIRRVQDTVLLGQERRVVNMLSTANLPAGSQVTLVGANQWNNAAFAGSIEQTFDTATETVRIALGGLNANTAVIPKAAAKVVKRDSKVRDLIKYTHSDLIVDGELPGKLWNLDIIMPRVSSVTSVENPATALAPADVWGKNVFVLYKTDNPGLDMVTFAYILRQQPWTVRTWRDEEIRSQFYEPGIIQTEKIVANVAAYGMFSVIA
jgi:hypothetical protein